MPKKFRGDKKTRTQTRAAAPALHKPVAAIGDLLARRPLLRALGAAQAPQTEWRQWLQQTLPPELAAHLVQVVLKPGQLIAYADGAVWSNRLRYALAAIAGDIAARDHSIRRTTVRVAPSGTAPRVG
jgi:hypothetical protein